MDRRRQPRSADVRAKVSAAWDASGRRARLTAMWRDPAYLEQIRETRRAAAWNRLPGRFWRMVDKSSECWEWTGYRTSHGYGQTTLPGGKSVQCHRLAWFIETGEWPPSCAVLRHKCDNPACVRLSHLELGDHKSNAADRVQRNRSTQAKLTTDQVQSIRLMKGTRPAVVAEQFDIAEHTASGILNGRTWKSLPWPDDGAAA